MTLAVDMGRQPAWFTHAEASRELIRDGSGSSPPFTSVRDLSQADSPSLPRNRKPPVPAPEGTLK